MTKEWQEQRRIEELILESGRDGDRFEEFWALFASLYPIFGSDATDPFLSHSKSERHGCFLRLDFFLIGLHAIFTISHAFQIICMDVFPLLFTLRFIPTSSFMREYSILTRVRVRVEVNFRTCRYNHSLSSHFLGEFDIWGRGKNEACANNWIGQPVLLTYLSLPIWILLAACQYVD